MVASFLDSGGNITNTIHLDPGSNIVAQTVSRYEGALLIWTRDGVGTVTTNVYDGLGNLTGTATLDAAGAILSSNTFGYDANGNQTTSVVWRRVDWVWEGATNTSVFDAQNRLVQSIDALGFTNTTVYNGLGRVEQSIDKLGRVTRFEFDTQGRQWRTVYPDQSSVASGFDAAGRVRFSTNQLEHVTEYRSDALGRQTNVIYPDLAQSFTVFDEAGRARFTVDALGVTNAFGYDRAGRRVAVTNALGVTGEEMWSTFAFDPNGNQLYVSTAVGVMATNHFDSLNRLTERVVRGWNKNFHGF